MSWKNIFAFVCGCLYLVLGSLLFYQYRIDILCGYERPCLRFCSTDTTEYSDKQLFDSLLDSNMTHWYENKFEDVTIYRGYPECSGKIMNIKEYEEKHPDEEYSSYYLFSERYRIYEDGDLNGRGVSYVLSRYCINKVDNTETIAESPLNEWMPMICSNEESMQKPVVVSMTVLSVIILAFTLLVYSYFPDLRDFSGKMIIFFLISMLCTYLIIPGIFEMDRTTSKLMLLIRVFGFSSGNFWINSMLLSNYFRIKDFTSTKPKEDKFKSYAIYVSTFTAFNVLFVLWEFFAYRYRKSEGLISSLQCYLIFNDLVIIIMTLIVSRKIWNQIDYSERAAFEKEKKIFWIYVKLFAIMSVTWSIQLFVTSSELNQFGCLTTALIMLFTAVNVAGLFLGRKKVREILSQWRSSN